MTLELAYRENDGVQVALIWDRDEDALTVAVHDAKKDEAFEVPVGDERPLEVFNHPYAYAAFRRDDLRAAA
jgi:hypothetical protein